MTPLAHDVATAQNHVVASQIERFDCQRVQGQVRLMPFPGKGQAMDKGGSQVHALQQFGPPVAIADEQSVDGRMRKELVQVGNHLV